MRACHWIPPLSIAMGLLVVLGQETQDLEHFGRRTPATREGDSITRGERVQFTKVTSNLATIRKQVSEIPTLMAKGVKVVEVGDAAFELRLSKDRFTDDELREVRKIVWNHHTQRSAQGKIGIEDPQPKTAPEVRLPPAPETWRYRFDAATSDSERITIIAEYIGFAAPPDTNER